MSNLPKLVFESYIFFKTEIPFKIDNCWAVDVWSFILHTATCIYAFMLFFLTCYYNLFVIEKKSVKKWYGKSVRKSKFGQYVMKPARKWCIILPKCAGTSHVRWNVWCRGNRVWFPNIGIENIISDCPCWNIRMLWIFSFALEFILPFTLTSETNWAFPWIHYLNLNITIYKKIKYKIHFRMLGSI